MHIHTHACTHARAPRADKRATHARTHTQHAHTHARRRGHLEGEARQVGGVVADRVVEGDADAKQAVVDQSEGGHAHRGEADEQQHLE